MLCGHEASCSIDIGKSVWRIVEWYCLEMSSNAIGNRIKGTQNTFLYSVKASIFKGFQRKATFYYPIWWYVAPTIINTFLESYHFSGKTIIPFATSGGSGMGRTNENLKPSCPGAVLMPGKMLNGSLSETELKNWAENIGL